MISLRKKRSQIITAGVANILGVILGVTTGWSSPVLAKMTGRQFWKNSPLDFVPSAEQQSYIACMLPFGGIMGSVIASPCTSKTGRKTTLLISALIFIASFLILIFTDNLFAIYIARFLQGIGNGIGMVALPIYVGEISSVECRGILTNFINISSVFGIFFAYCCGPYLTYISFQIVCLIIPIIFMVSFVFMPETPHYYLMKRDKLNALKVLKFLHQDENEINRELMEIEDSIDDRWTNDSIEFEDIFKGRGNKRALLISVSLICLQNLIGIDAIVSYGEIIFRKAGSEVVDPSIVTIIFGVFMLLSSFIALFYVDDVGRKCLLLISAAGSALSLAIIGTYFYFDEQFGWKTFELLPATSLIIFIIFYNLGFGPIPITILSEMFAPEIKSPAVSFAVSISWIASFAVTKAFLPLENIIHTYGNFWLLSGFCIVSFLFTAKFVFETKGLSLNQIQLELNKNYVAIK